jgi:aerotaxis receptor
MRNNQPVTNVETLLPEGQFIYSRTDLKGTITEANEAFAKISGYRREDMLGQPHNMVRHPDMPTEAFEDMWRDLKQGRPWRGIVKNRRQDGGFYWVVANASPVRERGQIIGYQSVRTCPSREEIKATEAVYQRLKRGDKSIRIFHGRAVPARKSVLSHFAGLGVQPMLFGIFTVLLSIAIVGTTLFKMEQLYPVLQALGPSDCSGVFTSCSFLRSQTARRPQQRLRISGKPAAQRQLETAL